MYKVLLVDDEPWVLKGIRETFDWSKEGFTVIQETTRSVVALEIILEERPDVVFTDIRMPKISGIELMQKVREQGLDTEFVVISGFNDFVYAQQALQQGAFDYCLKPLQMDYAERLLVKLRKHLDIKKRSRDMELYDLIMGGKGNMAEMLKYHGLACIYPYYQVTVLLSREQSTAVEPLKWYPDIQSLKVSLGGNKILYIVNIKDEDRSLFDMGDLPEASIGISRRSASPEEIPKLFAEADAAASNYFIYHENKVFFHKRRDIGGVNRLVEKVISTMEANNPEKFRNVMEEICESFKNQAFFMEDVVYFWNQAVAHITKQFACDRVNTDLDFMDYEQLLYRFSDLKSLCEYLVGEVLYLTGEAGDTNDPGKNINAEFNKLLKYIQEHFQEQLFLRELAKIHYLSENYCCYLFKKHTGSTFSDYVNKLRVEKSRELLRNLDLAIDEIAEQVGYNDYFYFNKVFKKYHGTTPSKYRKSSVS
jgi:two-component system, response regulator YesN